MHFEDIRHLLHVLQALVDKGNTVLVIEHNMDVVKVADHVIDLGPEGGDGGGRIVAEGRPEDVAKTKGSYTGIYLKDILARSGKTARKPAAKKPAPKRKAAAAARKPATKKRTTRTKRAVRA